MSTLLGLEISADAIRAVALRKRFQRVQLVAFGEEAICENATPEQVADAIQRLCTRLALPSKNVVAHLEGPSVRHFVLDTPPLTPAELAAHVRQSCLARLPKHFNPEQLLCAFHVFEQTEDKLRLLVSCCHAQAAQERARLLATAGLQPRLMGSALDLANAFVFATAGFLEQTILFVEVKLHGSRLLVTQKGNPIFWRDLPIDLKQSNSSAEMAKILSQWQREQNATPDQIVVLGETDRVAEVLKRAIANIEPRLGKPLHGLLAQEEALPAQYSLAAGLALKGLFPLLNTIDLLPEENAVTIRQQQQKVRALRTVLTAGAATFLLLLVLHFTEALLQHRLETAQEQALLMKTDLLHLTHLKKEHDELEHSWRELEKLAAQRSQEAEFLYELAKLLPEGAWLEEIAILPNKEENHAKSEARNRRLELRGWALEEAALAALLARLEESRLLREVQLQSSTRVSAEEVLRRGRIKAVPLVFFIIAGIL